MALGFCHVDLARWDWTRRKRSSIDMQSLAMQVIQGVVDYSPLYLIRPMYVRKCGERDEWWTREIMAATS